MTLKEGMIFEGYELIQPLKKTHSCMPTWLAKGTDSSLYVLRFLAPAEVIPSTKEAIEPVQFLPPIDGFITWSDWKHVAITNKITLPMLCRPYFSGRMIDHFLPDIQNPPSKSLLMALTKIANIFDAVEKHSPQFNFDLSPGNLLMDGDKPVVVDCGLAHYAHYNDMNTRSPFSSHVEPEDGIPLSACYPSMWQLWAATKSPYHLKIDRTDAQYALGVLYVYLRTRTLIFDDPDMPFPKGTHYRELFMPRLQWVLQLHVPIQAYEERGVLDLPMIPNEQEKNILKRALARDRKEAYQDCVAFIGQLSELS